MIVKEKPMLHYQAPAVQKAFLVLKTVADSQEGIGISKISKALGYSKSTTHGIIQALLKVGALDQSPYQKKLYIGTSFVEMALKNNGHYKIAQKIKPILDNLRNSIDQTVFLGILNQNKCTILATAKASDALAISASPGSRIPLLAGAVGKVFLASLKREAALKILRREGLKQFTPHSITDETVYMNELPLVRKNGYALDNREYLEGVRAVAVNPGTWRDMPLVLWVVGFVTVMTDRSLPSVIEQILSASEQASRLLA